MVDDTDDEVSGEALVRRTPLLWGEAVEQMLEDHEETRRTTVNLELGCPSDPEHAEFSIDATTRWFESYQKRYYARTEAWLRELTGGERPSGGETSGIYDDPYVCLLTLSASSVPDGERVSPIDHEKVRRSSWSGSGASVYDTLRNTMRSLGFDSDEWQYERRSEPHTGKRSNDRYSLNSCYGHDHVILVVDGEVNPSELRPVIEKHVELCEWAGPEAHDLDVSDWDTNADDVGTVEIKDPEDDVEDIAAYVADYTAIDPLDLHERSTEYIMWAASVTAANTKTQTRSDAAGWAAEADACKQRYESDRSNQAVDHGESAVRSETRGVKYECAECGSPHGIDQSGTLTAVRTDTQPPAAADGGLDVESELRNRWPSARAAAAVGQTPNEKRRRDRIREYLRLNPDASPTEVLGALGLPPDARQLIEELDAGLDPTDTVVFERPPEWRVKSVTIGEEEYPASAGTGVEMVETIDPLDRLLRHSKLGCERSDGIHWRDERTGVVLIGGRPMAARMVEQGITDPEIVDEVVTAERVPDPNAPGSLPPREIPDAQRVDGAPDGRSSEC
ncbi:hypothetical protein [Halosimplex aquaticum]|uniref:hypothetical protein n=1 Tax=Halosimplex aquaticum TaxID=3026162 RepID=UPI0023687814|nr:hypothetical protein [Halosimplex aquaticum]